MFARKIDVLMVDKFLYSISYYGCCPTITRTHQIDTRCSYNMIYLIGMDRAALEFTRKRSCTPLGVDYIRERVDKYKIPCYNNSIRQRNTQN